MRRIVTLALLCAHAASAQASLIVVADVNALDGAVDAPAALALRDKIVAAGALAAPHASVVGGDLALMERADAPSSSLSPQAASLLKRGEERLLAFDNAPAAAALAECAALLEPSLSTTDADTWARCRMLEGVAWVDAGNADAARDAFTKLLVLRPDFVPDASLLSPAAHAAFDDASRAVRAAGLGTLTVTAAADSGGVLADGVHIVVDGVDRGVPGAPIGGLAAGVHRVVVTAAGYGAQAAEIVITGGANAEHASSTRCAPRCAPRASTLSFCPP